MLATSHAHRATSFLCHLVYSRLLHTKTRTPCGYSDGAMPNRYVNNRQTRYENIFSLTVDVFAKNIVTWIYEFILCGLNEEILYLILC